MGRINWGRVKVQSQIQTNKEYERETWHVKTNLVDLSKNELAGLWPFKGKYYKKPIHSLPLSYLEWIIDKTKLNSNHRQISEAELRRRFKKLPK